MEGYGRIEYLVDDPLKILQEGIVYHQMIGKRQFIVFRLPLLPYPDLRQSLPLCSDIVTVINHAVHGTRPHSFLDASRSWKTFFDL